MAELMGKRRVALAVVAVMASANASAVPIILDSVSGGTIVWSGGPVLTATSFPAAAAGAALPAAQAVLSDGSAGPAAPGGNVELNRFGGGVVPGFGAVSTLSGSDGLGHGLTLSSLQLGDWTDGGNTLAKQYIQGAANRAGLGTLSDDQMTDALNEFFSPAATLGGLAPWQLLSDPNLSYVNIFANKVHLGLAGFLNATGFLERVFGVDLPNGLQASEVVKYTFGTASGYAYGFFATPSGVSGPDGVSFTGNFDIAIPEPAALALFGVGLLGLCLGRRRL